MDDSYIKEDNELYSSGSNKDIYDELSKAGLASKDAENLVNKIDPNHITAEQFFKKFGKPESEITQYRVCMKAGNSVTEWEIKADDMNVSNELLQFKLNGKTTFIVGINNLVYINIEKE